MSDKFDDAIVTAMRLCIDGLLFPTGSRYIGGAQPESDYDYVAKDTLELRNRLTDMGYERMSMSDEYGNGGYGGSDGYTNATYQLKVADNIPAIQVQLTSHLEAKLAVRDLIKNTPWLFEVHLNSKGTRYRQEIWYHLIEMYVNKDNTNLF